MIYSGRVVHVLVPASRLDEHLSLIEDQMAKAKKTVIGTEDGDWLFSFYYA